MNTYYCTSCGSKHEYTLTKPRFCQACGQQFGAAPNQSTQASTTKQDIKNTAPVPAQSQKKLPAFLQEFFEDDGAPLPQISKFDISIQASQSSRVTIGDVKNAAFLGEARPRGADVDPTAVQKKIQEQFRRDQSLQSDA